jgi:hypothetical protein
VMLRPAIILYFALVLTGTGALLVLGRVLT